MADAPLDAAERQAVQLACMELCWTFGYHVDRNDFEAAASLFTPDCFFDRMGQELRSPGEIVAGMTKDRPPDVVTRHAPVNFHFTRLEPDVAEAVVYSVTFNGFGSLDEGPLTLGPGSPRFVEFRDRYVRAGSTWRIAERIARLLFTSPAAAT